MIAMSIKKAAMGAKGGEIMLRGKQVTLIHKAIHWWCCSGSSRGFSGGCAERLR